MSHLTHQSEQQKRYWGPGGMVQLAEVPTGFALKASKTTVLQELGSWIWDQSRGCLVSGDIETKIQKFPASLGLKSQGRRGVWVVSHIRKRMNDGH